MLDSVREVYPASPVERLIVSAILPVLPPSTVEWLIGFVRPLAKNGVSVFSSILYC